MFLGETMSVRNVKWGFCGFKKKKTISPFLHISALWSGGSSHQKLSLGILHTTSISDSFMWLCSCIPDAPMGQHHCPNFTREIGQQTRRVLHYMSFDRKCSSWQTKLEDTSHYFVNSNFWLLHTTEWLHIGTPLSVFQYWYSATLQPKLAE